MTEIAVNSPEAATCLRILEEQAEPITAADMAAKLHLAGNRETQRRRVRAIVRHLRENGSRIVATLTDGYWLTEDEKTWREFQVHRQVDAKRILAESQRKVRQVNESGQGMLFQPPIFYGDPDRS